MPSDFTVQTPAEFEDPSEQTFVGRMSIGPDDVQQLLQHQDVPDDFTWSDVNQEIQRLNDWYTDQKHRIMAALGIDGYGFDLSFGTEIGAGIGISVEPLGLSVLWITNSTTGAADNNPHFYAFHAESLTVGADLGVGATQSLSPFYATHWGDQPKTSESWAGPVVSADVEAGGALGVGAQVEGSYFSAVDYDSTMAYGTLNFGYPSSGWHGISYSGGIQQGVGLEIAVGFTMVDANANIVEFFGRPDVREVFEEEPVEITEEGEFHYQKDVAGGGFFSWLADVTSGVGDELEQ